MTSSNLLCLSNHTIKHSQSDFDNGTIVFALPTNLRTSTWTHVALETLNIHLMPIIRDSITVVMGDRQITRTVDTSGADLLECIRAIHDAVQIEPIFTLQPDGHVRVNISPPIDRVIISNRLACCLGLQETALSTSFVGPFHADVQAGLSPLLVCAPKLVHPAHHTSNQSQMDILKILPSGMGRYAHTFDTTDPLPLAGSLRQEVSIQFCSPAFPSGIPMKSTPIYAVLRLSASPDDI